MKSTSKPLIESIINTTALALTAFGVQQVTAAGNNFGYLAIFIGLAIEWFKYWGRKAKFW